MIADANEEMFINLRYDFYLRNVFSKRKDQFRDDRSSARSKKESTASAVQGNKENNP
jgi:hypothetical protein